MLHSLNDAPGRIYVAATLLPMLAFAILITAGMLRRLCGRNEPGWLDRLAGYLSVGCMAAATCLAVIGLSWYLQDTETYTGRPASLEKRWAERVDWVTIGNLKPEARPPASALELGYRIDRLTALMFTMVTVIGSLIFLFSIGYMADEMSPHVEDHQAHTSRRGRFGRFFLYMSLFAFAMLNLLIADNLFQVFVGWELVGVCSFFLIGFYYERGTASTAANKAFIMNRVGDAGFIVGLGVAFAQFGTLNIQDLSEAVSRPGVNELTVTLMGLGIFCGCVGKSAQFPLHTWLPDAMEGPTPVSALIHAATMVAAGVYLVGRCYRLFTPDVFLVIAYVGAITLFLSAIVATVQTDIKRVLAYSTCSQLGYMMLALGVGGWAAGLLHLLTHAFFKALLFLCAGSVIHGLHHEQDLFKMGGLRKRMPVTAFTMLIGVLAIVGMPLFSGWYSKDQILAHEIGSQLHEMKHPALLILPAVTVLLTGYYMTRLWLLAFAGEARDHHVHEHARESPAVMTAPLVILAAFSIGVAWGWPIWEADESYLGKLLRAGEPATRFVEEGHHAAHEGHVWALGIGLLAAAAGAFAAFALFRKGVLARPARAGGAMRVRAFLFNRLYFDELYDFLFTRPVVGASAAAGAFDKRPTDKQADDTAGRRVDPGTLDGLLNAVGQLTRGAGVALHPLQSGRLRQYILVLGLTVVAALGILLGLTR
jgi:NADH-quinone oxidoreductase subunit L